VSAASDFNDLLGELTPRAIGVLVRRFGDFAVCEDAVQEALLAAATQWPVQGVPENPQGWLVTVASRRRIELHRADSARRRREQYVVVRDVTTTSDSVETDDTLTVLLLCCHPSLTVPSQVALTLRAVGGLTTAEIARAFLVPEATIAQRVSRAKQRIRESGTRFELPPANERSARIDAVLPVLYLIFTEGHTASSGSSLYRRDLIAEAIRLARQVHERLPDAGEAAGLLALMLLTDARRPARVRDDGSLVPLAEQDRSLWDRRAIVEGMSLIQRALAHTRLGPYQLQAAIAAVHAEAAHEDATDWPQILALYDLLDRLAPGPMVTLNRSVAVAMVHGPLVALEQLRRAGRDATLAAHHRLDAVRAHLLELAGDDTGARIAYERAARRTLSLPERRYLESRAARLAR
jgi:RNA polymerase sigma factor (sigma-70 family)